MPTLEEIARAAGTSRSTVSRVINNDPHVNPHVRNRVKHVIQQFNFHPNRAARSLAGGRTRVVGLVIPAGKSRFFSDPFFSELVQGVTSACATHDYSVMFWLVGPESEQRLVGQILQNGLIDGLVITSFTSHDPIVKNLITGNLPVVLIGRFPQDASAWFVDVDNRSASKAAVEHLIHTGRRRIAYISGPADMLPSIDRTAGYKEALSNHAVLIIPELISTGDFSEASGYVSTCQLINHHPDAIFAASDAMALGALRAIHEANLSIPQDVALIGFDDIPMAALAIPPLTTIRQPIQEMGACAANLLISRIEKPQPTPQQVILPTRLIVRNTA